MNEDTNNQNPFDATFADSANAVELAMQTKVRVEEKPKDLTKGQRPHVVIVWNDEEHSDVFVMDVLMKVCGMDQQAAFEAMRKIHNEGKGPVWTGLLEHCELKREQIATFRDEALVAAGAPNIPLNVTVVEG